MILSGGGGGEQLRLRGVDGGKERFSQKDAVRGVEGVDDVLSGPGEMSADTPEVHEGVKAVEGAGDLLSKFHPPLSNLKYS